MESKSYDVTTCYERWQQKDLLYGWVVEMSWKQHISQSFFMFPGKCRSWGMGLGKEPLVASKVMILTVTTRGCSMHVFLSEQLPLTEIASPSNRDRISALRMWKISMSTAAHKMEKNMVLAMCLEKSEAFNLTVLESLPLYWQAKIFLKNLSDLVLDCMVNREKQLGYPHYNYFLSFGTAAILIVRFFFF